MRILLIHNEAQYFGGAEKMLDYFLSALPDPAAFMVACVPGSKVEAIVPPAIEKIALKDNGRASILKIISQARTLRRASRDFPFDVVHGWAARDWETASVFGWIARRPVLGTLHDHPRSTYITSSRQRLMRLCARYGLTKVVCVSGAVRGACLLAGYQPGKLAVIRNGLPRTCSEKKYKPLENQLRLGYLGGFQENKGFAGVFEILRRLYKKGVSSWTLVIAGGPSGAKAEAVLSKIRSQYCDDPWWSSIEWVGWVEHPMDFMASLDLLIFPSTAFDSFPNVLLEAGKAGIPVLAACVGGVPEIVDEGQTGCLFGCGNWEQAAEILVELIRHPERLRQMGEAAADRSAYQFSVEKMIANYGELYLKLQAYV